jgi:dimethylaniline monooxygenase (N-oxide forming)
MSRIAIIGAGPGGLIAAKELLEKGISPTVFESTSSIGGIWSSVNRKTWKSLKANQSKFTCCFTDLLWDESVPVFPSQSQLCSYLTEFSTRFGVSEKIKFNSHVTAVKRNPSTGIFKVFWRNNNRNNLLTSSEVVKDFSSDQQSVQSCFEEEFDQVIVASGFFSRQNSIPISSSPDIKVITSEDYYDPFDFKDQNVAVIGGAFSGCEIASELTKTAKHVYHIFPEHVYSLPKHIPIDATDKATSFRPIDLSFYELDEEKMKTVEEYLYEKSDGKEVGKEGNVTYKNVEVVGKTIEKLRGTHDFFQKILGRKALYRHKEGLILNYPLSIKNEELLSSIKDLRFFMTISDDYRNCLNSQNIHLIHGKVMKIENNNIFIRQSSVITSTLESPSSPSSSIVPLSEIIEQSVERGLSDKIDTCIICGGARPNLQFLDSEVLNQLEFDENDCFTPLVLYKDIYRSEVPGLYFVGMYKGPYFGVMEMEAVSFFFSSLISFSPYFFLFFSVFRYSEIN